MERHADPVTLDDLIRLRKENERYLKTIDRYRDALYRIFELCDEADSHNINQKISDIWEITADSLGIRPHYL